LPKELLAIVGPEGGSRITLAVKSGTNKLKNAQKIIAAYFLDIEHTNIKITNKACMLGNRARNNLGYLQPVSL
jgi:hypothetical protein